MFILSVALAGICLIAAAIFDMGSRRIPNTLPVAIAVAFVFGTSVEPSVSLWPNVAIGLAVLLVGAGIFSLGWLGGGDVKLLSAVSLWSGNGTLVQLLAVTAIAGGVLGCALLAMQRLRRLKVSHGSLDESEPVTVPYGVAIASGGFCVLAEQVQIGGGFPWG